jgi:hypothetical protein
MLSIGASSRVTNCYAHIIHLIYAAFIINDKVNLNEEFEKIAKNQPIKLFLFVSQFLSFREGRDQTT